MSVFANEDGGVKSWVTYSLVTVAVLVGVYFVRAAWNKGDTPTDIALLCVNKTCGYTTSRVMEVGEAPPLKCPKCGKDSVYPAIKCPKCGAANVWNADLGIKGPTKCNKCGTEIT